MEGKGKNKQTKKQNNSNQVKKNQYVSTFQEQTSLRKKPDWEMLLASPSVFLLLSMAPHSIRISLGSTRSALLAVFLPSNFPTPASLLVGRVRNNSVFDALQCSAITKIQISYQHWCSHKSELQTHMAAYE